MNTDIQVGQGIRYESLSIFPLFTRTSGDAAYRLSEDAFRDGSVTVQEVGKTGVVGELVVENKSDTPVLFLEGDELLGVKQNRVLNTTLLVPAHTKLQIPVSCVERGRWRHGARKIGVGMTAPTKLRSILKKSVGESLKRERKHKSNQGQIWREVRIVQQNLHVRSETEAMSDTFASLRTRLAESREQLPYARGASGLVACQNDRILGLDMFDQPSTCQTVWDRLLSSYVIDAIQPGSEEVLVTQEEVQDFLSDVDRASWEESPAIGQGQHYRAETSTGYHATKPSLGDTVVHLSALAST